MNGLEVEKHNGNDVGVLAIRFDGDRYGSADLVSFAPNRQIAIVGIAMLGARGVSDRLMGLGICDLATSDSGAGDRLAAKE